MLHQSEDQMVEDKMERGELNSVVNTQTFQDGINQSPTAATTMTLDVSREDAGIFHELDRGNHERANFCTN